MQEGEGPASAWHLGPGGRLKEARAWFVQFFACKNALPGVATLCTCLFVLFCCSWRHSLAVQTFGDCTSPPAESVLVLGFYRVRNNSMNEYRPPSD